MIHIEQAVIVEGKYDKIKLSGFIDAPIITTEGFGIFKDKERQKMLRLLAQSKGLIVLTDSDSAGFIIRSFIGSSVDKSRVINAYIPEIAGKERRKTESSKEGILGVEGMSEEVILKALQDAGVFFEKQEKKVPVITKMMLYELGFSGGKNASEHRKKLLFRYGLPSRLTTNSLVEVLNCITTPDELKKVSDEITGSEEEKCE